MASRQSALLQRQPVNCTLALLVLCSQSVNAWPVFSLSNLWGSQKAESTTLPPTTVVEVAGHELTNQLAKAINFFPIPVSDECLSNDGRRTGICLNTYECRIQNGQSHGPCALGFGVCCIFTASCGKEVDNNVTYFVNPHFPGLSRDSNVCTIQVKKISPEISQLRLDFVHFNLGQPNRRTGVCEMDTFVMSGGTSKQLTLCGQNSGHHVYYDVENVNEPITITMNMTRDDMNRMWEIKVTQIEFNQRAPAGCMQYFREPSGLIQTWNFAENGRHLADQDYTICTRQAAGMCSIVYEPCDDNSFKIGPPQPQSQQNSRPPPAMFRPQLAPGRRRSPQRKSVPARRGTPPGRKNVPKRKTVQKRKSTTSIGRQEEVADQPELSDQLSEMDQFGDMGQLGGLGEMGQIDDMVQSDEMGQGGEMGQADEEVQPVVADDAMDDGSGGGVEGDPVIGGDNTRPMNDMLGGEDPMNDMLAGDDPINVPVEDDPGDTDVIMMYTSDTTRACEDRIIMPCDSEEFIMADPGGSFICDLLHCGSSFCNDGESPCRIESSTTPFNIRVQFGPGTRDESPDDNLGMCLRYEQQPCGPG